MDPVLPDLGRAVVVFRGGWQWVAVEGPGPDRRTGVLIEPARVTTNG